MQKTTSNDYVKVISMSRKELLEITLKLLRCTLRTHHSGKSFCSNNKKWGHSWISVLALERMMHGFDAVQEFFPKVLRLVSIEFIFFIHKIV